MNEALRRLAHRDALSVEDSSALLRAALNPESSVEQLEKMLGLLHHRPTTSELLTGFALELASRRTSIEIPTVLRQQLIDVCGTGGDGKNGRSTFNVSTTVAFLVRACAVPIAKHGNRAISSRSGSFDLLDALRVPFCQNPIEASAQLQSCGLAFLFAPSFQPSLKTIGAVRKRLGIRTLFNALGPLLNPAHVRRQVIGVYERELLEPMAHALRQLGTKHALVVHGEDGLDEISMSARTQIIELKNGELRSFVFDPRELGLELTHASAFEGGDAETNAAITESILRGEISPRADLVCVNTGAALVVAGQVSTVRDGFALAREVQRRGDALSVLARAQAAVNLTAALSPFESIPKSKRIAT